MSRDTEIREAVETWRKDAQFGYRNLERAALMVVEQYDLLAEVHKERDAFAARVQELEAAIREIAEAAEALTRPGVETGSVNEHVLSVRMSKAIEAGRQLAALASQATEETT